MNKNTTLKPWILNIKAFFMLYMIILFTTINAQAQNVLEKKLSASDIETITINGNQIFSISVSTAKTDYITATSALDGEYQNQFQVVSKQENHQLQLSLEYMSFIAIADDKRNAHKIIAATLNIEIPENLSVNISSDIGSANLEGNFKSLDIELIQGHCKIVGNSNATIINTIDGDINVVTDYGDFQANSNHGAIVLDNFNKSLSIWKLQSINGNITVAKQE